MVISDCNVPITPLKQCDQERSEQNRIDSTKFFFVFCRLVQIGFQLLHLLFIPSSVDLQRATGFAMGFYLRRLTINSRDII